MTAIDFDRVNRFLVQDALPFWSTAGSYDNGCFVEHLDLNGTPVDPGFTRTRVQARQIYVFCHAHVAGLMDAGDMCARAVEFFMKSAWLGPERGWAKLIDRQGAVLDGGFDFYDVSFALFALGWYYRLSGDPRCLALAHQTLDFLKKEVAHPAGGFLNDAAASQPRQQNPHMHLIEAMNVWHEATGDDRFSDVAGNVLHLFETRFCDPHSGALYEFFGDDWRRLEGEAGKIVEPGHQFEWAWIIGHRGRLAGQPCPDLMRRLIDSALRGHDVETGLTIDQVDDSGRPLAASLRLWPQTEAIKAALAEREFLHVDTNARIATILGALFERFLDVAPVPGTWIDHFDAHGSPIVNKIPASSLYHLTLAFLELLRMRPQLAQANPLTSTHSPYVL